MAGNISVLLALILLTGMCESLSYKEGNCPFRNSIKKCMPSCVNDFQCGFNEKCCPNQCGSMSCAMAGAFSTGPDGGYKSSSRDESVYCAGTKCRAHEKCQFDRNTKREKCMRY